MTSHVGHVYDFRATKQYVSQERIDSVNGIAFFFSMMIKVKHLVGVTQVQLTSFTCTIKLLQVSQEAVDRIFS